MLKQVNALQCPFFFIQPPSGGCVLKLGGLHHGGKCLRPAAFRRLCVETPVSGATESAMSQPPSGGCVLKRAPGTWCCVRFFQPPSGGCVLKLCKNETLFQK